jgi:hypothetical protein
MKPFTEQQLLYKLKDDYVEDIKLILSDIEKSDYIGELSVSTTRLRLLSIELDDTVDECLGNNDIL